MISPPLYLYLNELGHADAWTNGGEIPISLASSYLSDTRSATKTPDELLQRKVEGLDPKSRPYFSKMYDFGPAATHCLFEGNVYHDELGTHVIEGWLTSHQEDSLIVCLSRARARITALRLGKVACIKIANVDRLRLVLEEQTGRGWSAGIMKYTSGPDRSHLLKSLEDSWQHEFRLFSQGSSKTPCWVRLPPGIGELIDLDVLPPGESDGTELDHRLTDRNAKGNILPGLPGYQNTFRGSPFHTNRELEAGGFPPPIIR